MVGYMPPRSSFVYAPNNKQGLVKKKESIYFVACREYIAYD